MANGHGKSSPLTIAAVDARADAFLHVRFGHRSSDLNLCVVSCQKHIKTL